MKVDFTPAYILHQRPYRETSLLLDVFSQQRGRVSLIVKGVRNKKRSQQGKFQLYQPLLFSWFGHGELHTVNASEVMGPRYLLKGNATLCGLYLNELLVKLLPINEPESDIFNAYQIALEGLQLGHNNEIVLRLFEKRLLTQLGYGLSLGGEAETGNKIVEEQRYYYQVDMGLFPWQQGMKYTPITGRSLLHFHNETSFDQQSLQEIKQLTRLVINHYLGGKPLQSRALFAQLQTYANKN